VTNDIKKVADGLKSLSSTPPGAKSDQVIQWQRKTSDIVDLASKLSSTANALPGAAAGSVSLSPPSVR